MTKTFYFMAGLPRSGSSVLSAILNQNPRFYSGPSSPVITTMINLEQHFSNDELFLAHPKVEQAKEIISSIPTQFYSDRQEPVIFDKNRSWSTHIQYISGYFDTQPKIIYPVRDIAEILCSFISMLRRNPYEINGRINFIDEMLVKNNIPLTDDNRCEFLASSNGILGQSVDSLRSCLIGNNDSALCLVEYNDLINHPQETMERIYDFLDEEPFEHTFSNLKNENRENDGQIYGFSDMHEVRSVLKSTSKDPKEVLSQNILGKCENAEFWRTLDNDN